MNTNENENPFTKPCPADIDAIDRVLEHGIGSSSPQDEREQRLHGLLGLLDTPVVDESHRQARVDLLEVLAKRTPRESAPAFSLSSADQTACDEYIDAGYDIEAVAPHLRERASKVHAMGLLLTRGQIAGSGREQLVEATLGGIQSHIDAEQSAMRIESRRGFQLPARWADLVSIAAVLLLAASVIMPIVAGMRSASQQGMCLNNMNQAASAFGLYTGENRDMLPMATAGFGPTWMDVGTTPDRSNSSNLYTLIRKGFSKLDDLACPSNPNAETGIPDPRAWDWKTLDGLSYSYRIMPRGGMRATVVDDPQRVVLLADRSPVILRIKRQLPVIPEENSPNHNSTGQHMLKLDGSAQWSRTPMLDSKDNIWLPRPIESIIHQAREKYGIITGNEQPDGPTDAFVGP